MKFNIALLFVLFISAGCSEILFEDEISNLSIELKAPSEDIKLDFNLVNFHWESLDGVDQYNLQIARPNFEAAEIIILDTIILGNSHKKLLNDGNYEWRVRGLNSAYSTSYSNGNFIIDTSG